MSIRFSFSSTTSSLINHGGRMPNILVKSILSSIGTIYRKHYILYRPTGMSVEPDLIKAIQDESKIKKIQQGDKQIGF